MWHEKPTKINNIDSDIYYIMCVDENGNSNLINLVKKINECIEISNDERYFTLTGCIFERKEYFQIKTRIEKIKNKYWSAGTMYDCKLKIQKKVCFHSRDIRKHEGIFNENIIDYPKFIVDLSNTMKKIKCKIISINIDLYLYFKKGYTHSIYNVAFDLLLERYIYCTKNNSKGIIMLEARGKEEDKKLLKHIVKVIRKTGTKKISSGELKRKVKGVYFNPKWNENYDDTFVGLEIVDLISYPIHKYIMLMIL